MPFCSLFYNLSFKRVFCQINRYYLQQSFAADCETDYGTDYETDYERMLALWIAAQYIRKF